MGGGHAPCRPTDACPAPWNISNKRFPRPFLPRQSSGNLSEPKDDRPSGGLLCLREFCPVSIISPISHRGGGVLSMQAICCEQLRDCFSPSRLTPDPTLHSRWRRHRQNSWRHWTKREGSWKDGMMRLGRVRTERAQEAPQGALGLRGVMGLSSWGVPLAFCHQALFYSLPSFIRVSPPPHLFLFRFKSIYRKLTHLRWA